MLWQTGCRIGAAHSLDVSDFETEEQALAIRHRPDYGTPLKNKQSGERICALSEEVCDVLEDYISVTRDEVTDDHGREPLFTTKYGRMHRSKIREMVYAVTRPCTYGQDCPHGRHPDSCEAATYTQASKCPSSVSPHDIRRGSITHLLRNEVPKQIVADRVNSSPETLEKHYSQLTEKEKNGTTPRVSGQLVGQNTVAQSSSREGLKPHRNTFISQRNFRLGFHTYRIIYYSSPQRTFGTLWQKTLSMTSKNVTGLYRIQLREASRGNERLPANGIEPIIRRIAGSVIKPSRFTPTTYSRNVSG